MAPQRGDFGEGNQHKSTIRQPWMRQNQLVWSFSHLLFKWQATPMGLCLGIGQDGLTDGDQVQINAARSPTLFAHPPKTRLDPM